MKNLMHLLAEAEKTIGNLQSISTFLGQEIKYIAEQPPAIKNISSCQTISQLLEVVPKLSYSNVYGDIATSLDALFGGLAGKKVLDVGCDPAGRLIETISERFSVAEVVGINPVVTPKIYSNRCRIENLDIRFTPFPDNYFDCIVSISAFEHVHGFDNALCEMHRILKPGGVLFSNFGPLWSGSFGHHMWFTHREILYNYWNTFLPPYCHLLMTPSEIVNFCVPLYGEDVSLKIVEYLFTTTDQNRLLFSDYQTMISKTNFEVLFFNGYTHPVLSRLYVPENWPSALDALKRRYPHNDDFRYDGIELLLRKKTEISLEDAAKFGNSL